MRVRFFPDPLKGSREKTRQPWCLGSPEPLSQGCGGKFQASEGAPGLAGMQGGENWRGEVRTLAVFFGWCLDDFLDVLLNLLMIFSEEAGCSRRWTIFEEDLSYIYGLASDFVKKLGLFWDLLSVSRPQKPRSEEEESFWSRVISTIACAILSRHPAPVRADAAATLQVLELPRSQTPRRVMGVQARSPLLS